jgi:hypothetical protein
MSATVIRDRTGRFCLAVDVRFYPREPPKGFFAAKRREGSLLDVLWCGPKNFVSGLPLTDEAPDFDTRPEIKCAATPRSLCFCLTPHRNQRRSTRRSNVLLSDKASPLIERRVLWIGAFDVCAKPACINLFERCLENSRSQPHSKIFGRNRDERQIKMTPWRVISLHRVHDRHRPTEAGKAVDANKER